MGSFTVSLAILGGLVLAAMVGYNTWISRRHSPRQPDMPPPEVHDAAPPAAMPPLREAAGAAERHVVPDGERSEPLFDMDLSAAGGRHPGAPAAATVDRYGMLDPLIDVMAPVVLDAAVPGESVLAVMPATRRAGSKPVAIEGLNEHTGQWEPPAYGQRYSALQAGVQLANRVGPLNEIEFSEFVVKVQAFADAVNGTAEFPDMLDEVARARDLDQFASAHDAQLSFVLRASHAAWSPGYVQQHAAHLGFMPGLMPGRMVLPAREHGLPAVLGLQFDTQAALADDPSQSVIRELSISLDVPQVARAEQPFARMREIASLLAREMDGVITDSDGQLLHDEVMDAIGADLEQLYDVLDARELPAGSPLGRRLFS